MWPLLRTVLHAAAALGGARRLRVADRDDADAEAFADGGHVVMPRAIAALDAQVNALRAELTVATRKLRALQEHAKSSALVQRDATAPPGAPTGAASVNPSRLVLLTVAERVVHSLHLQPYARDGRVHFTALLHALVDRASGMRRPGGPGTQHADVVVGVLEPRSLQGPWARSRAVSGVATHVFASAGVGHSQSLTSFGSRTQSDTLKGGDGRAGPPASAGAPACAHSQPVAGSGSGRSSPAITFADTLRHRTAATRIAIFVRAVHNRQRFKRVVRMAMTAAATHGRGSFASGDAFADGSTLERI